MKVVAIIERSAGNDTVGAMWKETAIFDDWHTIQDVLAWAAERNNTQHNDKRLNVILSVPNRCGFIGRL